MGGYCEYHFYHFSPFFTIFQKAVFYHFSSRYIREYYIFPKSGKMVDLKNRKHATTFQNREKW